MSDLLQLPDGVRDLLLDYGPDHVDGHLRLHVDRACRQSRTAGPSVADLLEQLMADAHHQLQPSACRHCGLCLEPWLEHVLDVLHTLRMWSDSSQPVADAEYHLSLRASAAWALTKTAPDCCRPYLPTDALPDRVRAALEQQLAQHLHQHRISLDPYAGQERTHTLLLPYSLFTAPTSEVSPATRGLVTQHPCAAASLEDLPLLLAFALPATAAHDIATELDELAHLVPAADLDETTWRVLAALVATQHATSGAPRLAAALPRMLTAARAATT